MTFGASMSEVSSRVHMSGIFKILLLTILAWPVIVSGQTVGAIDLQDIKDQLIEESLNSVVEVRTLSLLNSEGELKQFSRFYSGRQFQSPYSQGNSLGQELPPSEVENINDSRSRVRFTSSAIPISVAQKLQPTYSDFNSQTQVALSSGNASNSDCEITNNFTFLPRGFVSNFSFDFSDKSQPGSHVLETQQELIIDEFMTVINAQVDENGLYLYREDVINPFPYASPQLVASNSLDRSTIDIEIKLIEVKNRDQGLADWVDAPLKVVGNTLGNYFGHNLNLAPMRQLQNRVYAQNNDEFSAELHIASNPNFLPQSQDLSERTLFSGTVNELVDFLSSLVTKQFEYYRDSHRCEMEYFVAYRNELDDMLIPVGTFSGINNSSKFILMPSKPSHQQVLNEDYIDLIRLAETVRVDEHATTLQVVGDLELDITGYAVIPL